MNRNVQGWTESTNAPGIVLLSRLQKSNNPRAKLETTASKSKEHRIHALEKRVSNFVVRHWEDWFATTRRRCIQPAKRVLCAFKHDSVLSLVTTWLYSLACSPKKPFLDPPVAVVVVVVYHFQACRDSFAARPLNTAPTKQSEFPIMPDTAERISG